MRPPRRFLWVLAVICISTLATGQDALVKIYTTLSTGRTQGTGFFTTNHGQIVTAYHVVQGAKAIEVMSEQVGGFTNIQVDFVSPEYDIAVLQVLNSGVTPFVKLASYSPTTTDDLQVQGYPLGGPYQLIRAYATRAGLVWSKEYNDLRGERLFHLNIEIIPLGAGVFSGMSGGPVLYRGQAIGILSGSYVQGGSIGWAIPSQYVERSKLREVRLKPDQIKKWEPLQLMDTAAWKTLRGMVQVNASAAAVSDQYFERIEALAQTYDELYKQAARTRQDIMGYRPFLEKVANDPSLANDPKTSTELLTEAREPLIDSLGKFGDLCDKAGEEGQQVAEVQTKLAMWIADQSHLDEKSGQALVKEIRAILDQHRDMIHGIDAYLNTDREAIVQSGANLAVAMKRSRGPADEARALLGLLDVWQPYVNAFASYRALTFMSAATGMFRQIGRLLEPIVYQTNVAR